VRVLDLLGNRRPLGDLQNALRTFAPEVVGFSVRNIDNVVSQRPVWHLGELAPMLALVRRESRARIVRGGPAVSILGALALAHLDADFAVIGEGEETFPALLAEWVLDRIGRAIGRCPGIVHAAEEGQSSSERIMDRALCALGVAPPYWRFLPRLLRVPPLPTLRRRLRVAASPDAQSAH
jgi:hypothetical protein